MIPSDLPELNGAAEASLEQEFADCYFFSDDEFGGADGRLLQKVDGLDRAGLLKPESVAIWRARALRFGQEIETFVPDVAEARQRARTFIAELIESRKRDDPAKPTSDYFYGALNALRDVGLFSEREWSDWEAPWEEAAGERDEAFKKHVEIGGDFEGKIIEHIDVGPETRLDGFRVSAVARLDDGISVYWHFNDLPAGEGAVTEDAWGDPFDELVPEPVLSDDVGTEYVMTRGSTQPVGEKVMVGSTSFAPAAPADAARLSVSVPDGSIVLEL